MLGSAANTRAASRSRCRRSRTHLDVDADRAATARDRDDCEGAGVRQAERALRPRPTTAGLPCAGSPQCRQRRSNRHRGRIVARAPRRGSRAPRRARRRSGHGRELGRARRRPRAARRRRGASERGRPRHRAGRGRSRTAARRRSRHSRASVATRRSPSAPAPVRKLLRIRPCSRSRPTRTAGIIRTSPIHDGGRLVPPPEIPERAERIRAAIADAGLGEIRGPDEFGPEPVLRVHTTEYVEFLETAHARWCDGNREPADARSGAVRPPDPRPAPRRHRRTSSPSSAGTRTTPIRSSTARGRPRPRRSTSRSPRGAPVADGRRTPRAYGLCRPPGHHAAADSFAGYCYLNNAAIAAQAWVDRGARVAILDVDFHHGNGTQQLFYDRDDVLFVSLHADPADDYPYFLGFASRDGAGARARATPATSRCRPEPTGTRYGPALDPAIDVDHEVRARWPGRVARRRHRGRGSRHASNSSPTTTRASAPRSARSPPRRCSCRKAATRSTCSAATSSACCAPFAGERASP